ncbi:toxin-antitoxin system YwqK family antitoxin [Pedobacter sp. ASV12]|uniref:toxin-antitoxin system YwqK family antitoxin n=1 Tax=Pedobacter sp. ASV12 TaxID=2795120 RepID=UPI0018EAA763|nr:hypothetical protein [Pedobacter sp. ASV12]
MKKYLIFSVLCMLGLTVVAQKPIYFVGDGVTSDAARATSYGIYGKLSTEDVWILKRYDLYDNLMQTGSYKDENLTIPHGQFVFYMDLAYFNMLGKENFKLKNKTRFKYQEGSFVDGLEQGTWTLFYPDGNILNIQHYKNGQLDGEFKTLDRYGRVVVSGHFVAGKKEGEWITEKGTKIETYEEDVLKSSKAVKPEKEKQQIKN